MTAKRFFQEIATLFLCVVLLSACTLVKQGLERPVYTASDADTYLAYFRYASNLSNDDLKKEYMTVSQVYGKSKSDGSRLQLALLLSMPSAGFRDDARALGLLKEVMTNKADDNAQLKDFALLLSTHLVERKKQEEKIKSEQGRAEELGQRLGELEQKLEALKGIERSIIERQQTQPAKIK